ncbi:inositol monophosphatase family protein [Duganella callida]|uniref:Inositol-phosphate phosphatase n=1 Tax=Duganella callida TaxID=2561932 RepID=A0A4Y9S920_9BURK|nr:inositol monophosphatase family protein [Duganella callida]TFW18121.1 inositol-phosphate phosphatase [Duganella callida]
MTAIDTEEVLALLRDVGAGLCVTYWRGEPVVEADDMMAAFQRISGAANAELRNELSVMYPSIAWDDDELDETILQGGEYWVCDAIDGAVQFLRAIPNWAMSLTLMREGVPVFSAVFDAMHDEMFHAVWGRGAYHNGARMRVNARADHYHAIVASGQPPFASRNRLATQLAGASLSAMLRDVAAARNLGPTSLQLAYVACGRLDAFWQYGEDGRNCIGGALLIREAGGVVTQADGTPYRLHSGSIAAAPPAVHASMLRRLCDVAEVW